MLSTGVECVSWTDHLSGRQTKLLSCPVVSVRDLKKLKIVKLNGDETEIPFYSTGTRVVMRCSPCRRRVLIEEAEAVDNPRCPDGNIAPIETGMDMDSG